MKDVKVNLYCAHCTQHTALSHEPDFMYKYISLSFGYASAAWLHIPHPAPQTQRIQPPLLQPVNKYSHTKGQI